jgi:hypothetical protein
MLFCRWIELFKKCHSDIKIDKHVWVQERGKAMAVKLNRISGTKVLYYKFALGLVMSGAEHD